MLNVVTGTQIKYSSFAEPGPLDTWIPLDLLGVPEKVQLPLPALTRLPPRLAAIDTPVGTKSKITIKVSGGSSLVSVPLSSIIQIFRSRLAEPPYSAPEWLFYPLQFLRCLHYYTISGRCGVFVTSTRELKRLEGFSFSPIFVMLSESLSGVTTIRANNSTKYFT